MSVITISRGSFSGGKMLAERIAEKLGYRCVDRDVVVERAAASGNHITQRDIREAMEKPPAFLERFSHKRYLYLALVQAALAEEVQNGKAVYHGNAGHLLLKSGPHLLRVRLVAPLEFRVRMVRERLKYERGEAIAYIEKMDEDRRKWVEFLYGVDWRDPTLYDLVINLEQLTIEQAAHVVCHLTLDRCFEFTSECQQVMDDLVLASRVRAQLALHPSTSDLELEVSSQFGKVSIRGKLAQVRQVDCVRQVASKVGGVLAVDLDGLAPPVRV